MAGGRPSLGPRRAFTLRLEPELVAALEQQGGTGNDNLTAVLRRGLLLAFSEQDVEDLQTVTAEVGFSTPLELVRAFLAREIHAAAVRRREAEANQVSGGHLNEVEPQEPPGLSLTTDVPDIPAPPLAAETLTVPDMEPHEPPEPPAPPFTADDLAQLHVFAALPLNGTRPLRIWPPPRRDIPRPHWES